MKRSLALVCASAVFLTGCAEMSFSIDSLLAAPKLTDEQTKIHQALISAVGRNITLKYPRNGSNRSAYVINDLDSDGSEEALVFYEYVGAEKEGIRVNLLDRGEDGEWKSVKELAGAGTDIDQVMISPMGGSADTDILVGYQNPTGSNSLEIYSYKQGEFNRLGTDSYMILQSADINSDGKEEIITVSRDQQSDDPNAQTKAYLLRLEDNKIVRDDGIPMCSGVSSYVKAYSGKLEDGSPAVYIDELNTDGLLQTEILYYKYSSLQNPIEQRKEKLLPLCTRPAGYESADIDGDGVYEIPTVKPMLGFENAVGDEQTFMTTWCGYEDFYVLDPKYSGYYSVKDGYAMTFPARWNDKVTVKVDGETGEAVFYKYEGNINAEMTELMRIKAAVREEGKKYLDNGYTLITSKGQTGYLVKLATNKREQLILTIDEVQNCFYTF